MSDSVPDETCDEQSRLEGSEVHAAGRYTSLSDCSPIYTPSVFSVAWDDTDFSNTSDIQVKVDDPQKHVTNMETFISFRVSTKTCRIDFESTEFVVRRRYSDFIWLRQGLVATYPFHIIPPLPERHSLVGQLDRFQPDFIRARAELLSRFLNALCRHSVLSCHKHFKVFVTLKPSDFSVYRQREGSSVLARVSNSLHKLSLSSSTRRPLELQQTLQSVESLCAYLSSFHRSVVKLQHFRQESLLASDSGRSCCLLWASSEQRLSSVFSQLANTLSSCCEVQRLLETPLRARVLQPLHEYVLYTHAVSEAATRRDALQAEYDHACQSVQKKHVDREQIRSGHAPSGFLWLFSKASSEQLELEEERLTQQIDQLAQERERLCDRLHCADNDISSDLHQWKVQQRTDVKRVFSCMADAHVEYYKQCSEFWQSLLASI